MMTGNRKEEGRVCTVLLHFIRNSPTPSENRLTAVLNWKKAKSKLVFKPSLPRQNAITLPLVLPPLPLRVTGRSYFFITLLARLLILVSTIWTLKITQIWSRLAITQCWKFQSNCKLHYTIYSLNKNSLEPVILHKFYGSALTSYSYTYATLHYAAVLGSIPHYIRSSTHLSKCL